MLMPKTEAAAYRVLAACRSADFIRLIENMESLHWALRTEAALDCAPIVERRRSVRRGQIEAE